MGDKSLLPYIIKEIKSNKGMPYLMHNEILLNEMLPFISRVFPEVQVIKIGTAQWIVVSEQATKNLIKRLQRMRNNCDKEISELDEAIKLIQRNKNQKK